MAKLTCTLTVTVTDETLDAWTEGVQELSEGGALEAVRSEIESWLDDLVQDGVLLSGYELAIREDSFPYKGGVYPSRGEEA